MARFLARLDFDACPMGATWRNYLLLPLAIGGAGLLHAQVLPDPAVAGAAIAGIRMFVGPVPATSANDLNPALLRVDVPIESGRCSFFGAQPLAGSTATWFVNQTPTGWVPGPVVAGVDLTPNAVGAFEIGADFVAARLREMVDRGQPLGAALPIQVRREYPSDTYPPPNISVMLDQAQPTTLSLSDLQESKGRDVGSKKVHGRIWQVSISCIGWCMKPGQRSDLVGWMGANAETLLECLKYGGFMEPSVSVREEEDSQLIGQLLFKAVLSVTASVHSETSSVVRTGFGRVTV